MGASLRARLFKPFLLAAASQVLGWVVTRSWVTALRPGLSSSLKTAHRKELPEGVEGTGSRLRSEAS